MPASNLIQFKRGKWADLQPLIRSGTQGVDGCFYLTVEDDTNKSSKLYVGRSDGKIVPVNQGCYVVSTVNDLSQYNSSAQPGDFAYITTDNILVIRTNEGTWAQMNDDVFLASNTIDITVTNGVASVSLTGTLNNGNSVPAENVNITGSNGINVSATARTDDAPAQLTIEGDRYSIGSAVSNGAATVTLESNDSNYTPGSFTIAGETTGGNANNVTIKGSDNNIIIEAKDTYPAEVAFGYGTNDEGFTLTLTDNYGNTLDDDSINPTITYGGSSTETVNFEEGNATLNIYSVKEVDNLLKSLNAMTFKGTIGSNGSYVDSTTIAGITHCRIGDTWMVNNGGNALVVPATKSLNGNSFNAYDGDLIIAVGTEYTDQDAELDPNVTPGLINLNTLKFEYVPSGNDINTTYAFESGISNGFELVDDTGQSIGKITLQHDNYITITDNGAEPSESNGKILTLGHKVYNAPTVTEGTAISNEDNPTGTATFTVISAVTADNGHVTGYTTQEVTIKSGGWALTGVSKAISVNKNAATIATTYVSEDSFSGNSENFTSKFDLGSSNLTIETTTRQETVGSDTVTVPIVTANFYWGTF